MNCYIMKALTHKGEWFEFTLQDLPALFTADEFALLAKPKSPRLAVNSIRRGDIETHLFEGDVIEMSGVKWLICYERGFYAINQDFVIRYLYTLENYEVLGTYDTIDLGIPIIFRQKYLFKYKDKIMRLQDIVGAYNGGLLLRFASKPISPDLIQQECCITYDSKRVYLGDKINGYTVELHGGRITMCKGDEIIDMITGGALDGYNPERFRR